MKYTSINEVGESSNSTEATFLCAATPSAPSAPKHVRSDTTSITIEWEASSTSGGSLLLNY